MLGSRMPYFLHSRLKRSRCSSATRAVRSATASPPDLRRPVAAAADQHLVGQHHRPQVPGQPVVAAPQPQEVQQRVEHVAAVRLRGDAVVVDVLAVVLHHRFDGHAQPVRGLVRRDGAVQLAQPAATPPRRRAPPASDFQVFRARPGAECRGGSPGS